MLVSIANRENPTRLLLQKQSDLGLPCLSRPLTLSLPMSPFGDQWQSANVAIMRLGHVVCFSDVYYPILRHIVANKEDNLNRRPVFGKQTRKWQKKS